YFNVKLNGVSPVCELPSTFVFSVPVTGLEYIPPNIVSSTVKLPQTSENLTPYSAISPGRIGLPGSVQKKPTDPVVYSPRPSLATTTSFLCSTTVLPTDVTTS